MCPCLGFNGDFREDEWSLHCPAKCLWHHRKTWKQSGFLVRTLWVLKRQTEENCVNDRTWKQGCMVYKDFDSLHIFWDAVQVGSRVYQSDTWRPDVQNYRQKRRGQVHLHSKSHWLSEAVYKICPGILWGQMCGNAWDHWKWHHMSRGVYENMSKRGFMEPMIVNKTPLKSQHILNSWILVP